MGQVIDSALIRVSDLLVSQIREYMDKFDLADSDLKKSVEVRPKGGDSLQVWFNDYGRYVISGRKKFARKVPIDALIKFIKKNGIRGRNAKGRFISVNSLAFAIQNAIYKNGIKGRDFLTPAIEGWFAFAESILSEALEVELELVFN